MRSTGIVRRLDDLGRIVIPKELRALLKLKSRDQVEIFTANDSIILKKYNLLELDLISIKAFINALKEFNDSEIIITNNERVILSSLDYINDTDILTLDFLNRIDSLLEKNIVSNQFNGIVENKEIDYNVFVKRLVLDYEEFGYIIILNKIIIKDDSKLADIITNYLNELYN